MPCVVKKMLRMCRSGIKFERTAAAHFQIPQSTNRNKLNGYFSRQLGGPTVHLFEEENVMLSM
jgi:hypothetical protein